MSVSSNEPSVPACCHQELLKVQISDAVVHVPDSINLLPQCVFCFVGEQCYGTGGGFLGPNIFIMAGLLTY